MIQSQDNKPIYIDEFDYPLADERIAKYPLARRDASKLLVYQQKNITESVFANISEYLPEESLLVYNNTRVIQARLIFQKSTGATIEVFCLEPLLPSDYALSLGAASQCIWKCMVGNLKKWKSGVLTRTVVIGEKTCEFSAELLETEGNTHSVRFSWDHPEFHFADLLESVGELPIPPYLHRKTEQSDLTTYQTVYSKIQGSVAAPTAGLHFTTDVFESLKPKNIEIEELTLHVGAGTFQPVKTQDVAEHHMHTEVIEVQKSTIEHLIRKRNTVIAVGTTSVRTLESLYFIGCMFADKSLPAGTKIHVPQWMPYETEYAMSVEESLGNIVAFLDRNKMTALHADTQIMIRPGYQFRIVKGMITNFHQPKSTLLLLVSAFTDGNWREIYDYALSHDFRFLSYGDSSLLMR